MRCAPKKPYLKTLGDIQKLEPLEEEEIDELNNFMQRLDTFEEKWIPEEGELE